MMKIIKNILFGLLITSFLLTLSQNTVYAAGNSISITKTVNIDKGKVTVNDNLISVPNSTFTVDTGDWNAFSYSGSSTNKSRQSGGINGYDYMRLTKSSNGDSGMQINITGLEKYTNYTISAYFRIPTAGSTFGNGLLFVVNGSNNAGISSFNRPSTSSCDWDLVKGTFSSGNNTSIWLRISTGDFKTVDVTAIKLEKGNVNTPVEAWKSSVMYPFEDYNNSKYSQTYEYDDGDYKGTLTAQSIKYTPVSKIYHHDPVYRTDYQTFYKSVSGRYSSKNDNYFSATYSVNENGYSGNIGRTSVSWTDNWETNRQSGTQSSEEYRYSRANDGGGMPGSKSVTVWDSGTNQYVSGSIPRISNQLVSQTQEFDYDYGYMWWLSNSDTYYDWDGRNYNYAWNAQPKWPEHKYGHWCQDEGKVSDSGWTQYSVKWSKDVDWSSLDGAPPQRAGLEKWDQPFFASDRGPWWSGNMDNYYRQVAVTFYKKAYTSFNFKGIYSGTISLPNRFIDYTGTAYYSGTLSKQVIDHYNDYYTSDEWNAQVIYTGTVYSYNTKPGADFTVTTPKLVNETLTYTDKSTANDPWDSITNREWSYSYDGKGISDTKKVWTTATSTPTTSFDLSEFPDNAESGTYNIRLRVKDKGNTLFPGIWSDYTYKDVTIYRRNTKPIAKFTVSPSIQDVYEKLIYKETSYDPDLWDSIVQREWSYKLENSDTWVVTGNDPPEEFKVYGKHKVRLRVKDKGNILSPGMWSDYIEREVNIKPLLSIVGTVTPNPTPSGRKLTIKLTTTGKAKRVKITFPKSIVDLAKPEDPLIIEKNVTIEPTHVETIFAWLPLETPQTLDSNGQRVSLAYPILIEAENQYGITVTDYLTLDVSGSVLDGLKTGIKATGYDRDEE